MLLLLCCCNRNAVDLLPSQPSSYTESSQPALPPESLSPTSSPEGSEASEASASVSEPNDWQLMLVNYEHPIPDDWSVDLAMTRYGYEVDTRITDAVDELITSAANDGVSLIICYGYRTVEQSRQLFEKQVNKQLALGLSQEQAVIEARRWVAPPGTSDHHTGLALDIVTPSHQVLNHEFADTDAGIWLAAHSWEHGFIVRFPKDKQDITGITYEPWHVRYVGKEHAASMRMQNECLEEYVSRLYGD
ncbi:MAG TPA: M15 family metallopeptidase [Clostridia bacterium]|nr:M15 family metallopeptidase [Clostridia bacterium]